jgi:hypothetical protein
MADTRVYTSRRMAIVTALAEELKALDGSGNFNTDVEGRVEPRLKFWDEIEVFPAIHLNAGPETRQYQGGGYKDRFLTVTVRCYVNETDAILALEGLIEDVETVLEEKSRLVYKDRQGLIQTTQQISIISIETDEGVLEPLGVGEVVCEIRY